VDPVRDRLGLHRLHLPEPVATADDPSRACIMRSLPRPGGRACSVCCARSSSSSRG
jgi:hypothetical protein